MNQLDVQGLGHVEDAVVTIELAVHDSPEP
jgi:hypothetical protein